MFKGPLGENSYEGISTIVKWGRMLQKATL